ncbi:Hsp70 family protein [Actinomycetospora termitidis]|uniref:Hsp70 family protein n=1 Tax=Actinomycetospora termitidis TaxID=3053470 RepID=A0ABT7M7H1_9PSEU|nr:Hsp70 family protein [Actinomycetospora sp. Odt1-22]MDL5156624.1 Hsp70 family protein [Actinomycetospora sp. Odt1-22]
MSYVLGVDLGTTTIAAAAGDAERVDMVPLGERAVLAPAVVARRGDGALLTGERAARRAVVEPERVAREVRRRLGDPTPVLLGDRGEPATDLLAAMLRGVVDRAVAVRGDRPERVVLAHPASWGPYRRGLFEDVAAAADLPEALAVPDPEAAARHVAAVRPVTAGAPVAVLDLGGTSCEASVVRDGTVVGAPVATERLGGADLDDAVSALVDEASGGLLAEFDPEDPASGPALARFRAECVEAKEALTLDDEVRVPLLLPGRHVDVTLTRAALEERIAPVVARVVETLRQALDAAPVAPGDLAAVLLVGGSARVPLVVRSVREAVAAPVVVEAHPDHVVALGAVRTAAAVPAPPPPAASPEPIVDGRTTLTPLRRSDSSDERTTVVRLPAGPPPPLSRPAGAPPGRVAGPPPGRAVGPPSVPFPPVGPPSGPFPGGPPSAPFRSPVPPPPAPPPEPAPPPSTGRVRTVLLTIVIAVVLLGALAAGVWFLLEV